MNKRLPILISLLALIVLAASIAYWVLQLYQPQQRPLAAAPVVSQPEPSSDAAATLFGGQPSAAISNFQLTGVVAAGSANSAAIIVADGAPPVAVRIGREVAPGVVVSEVHQRYVMLTDGGVPKRIDLASDSRAPATMNAPTPMTAAMPAPMTVPPGMEQQTSPGVVSAPPTMQSVPPPGGGPQGTPTTADNSQYVPEPQMDPGADPDATDPAQQQEQLNQQQQQQPQMPPNAAPVNAPSPQNPVR